MSLKFAVLLCLATGALAKNVFHFEVEENDRDSLNVRLPCKQNPKYTCAGTATCCNRNGTMDFTCCPFPSGVCCPDYIHCCPMRSHCDMVRKRCWRAEDDGIVYFPFVEAGKAIEENIQEVVEEIEDTPVEMQSVVCPDGKVECSNGQTCCPTKSSGSYQCCQYTNAVCCTDGQHCCPKDYKCDLPNKQCVSALLGLHPFLNWFSQPALPLE